MRIDFCAIFILEKSEYNRTRPFCREIVVKDNVYNLGERAMLLEGSQWKSNSVFCIPIIWSKHCRIKSFSTFLNNSSASLTCSLARSKVFSLCCPLVYQEITYFQYHSYPKYECLKHFVKSNKTCKGRDFLFCLNLDIS